MFPFPSFHCDDHNNDNRNRLHSRVLDFEDVIGSIVSVQLKPDYYTSRLTVGATPPQEFYLGDAEPGQVKVVRVVSFVSGGQANVKPYNLAGYNMIELKALNDKQWRVVNLKGTAMRA